AFRPARTKRARVIIPPSPVDALRFYRKGPAQSRTESGRASKLCYRDSRQESEMSITLKVNGRTHTLDLAPSIPLLYVLRNDIGLQGPRFGCGLGQCGACTVIINGVAVRSCVTPSSSVKGEITTLEGLAKDGTLHPIQQAWID